MGYKLKINGGSFVDAVIDVGDVLEYTIPGLTHGVEYAVQIAAYNDEGESAYSSPVYGTVLEPTLLTLDGEVLLDADGNAQFAYL